MKEILAFFIFIMLIATSVTAQNLSLTWNTFLGGSGIEGAIDIVQDRAGNIFVTGTSDSSWGTPKIPYSSNSDIFIAKLDRHGVLQWNTFLGGNDTDTSRGITIDQNGNVYVTGYSYATWGTPLSPFNAGTDAFVAKLNTNGDLQWHTFIGGSGLDYGNRIKADTNGDLYVVGRSLAEWGTPVNAFVGNGDAFAAKLNSSGTLLWNTFLGGSGSDYGNALFMDPAGNVYLTGYSESTWGLSPKRSYTALFDVFVAKLNKSGTIQWNTFLGSAGDDYSGGIVLDKTGNVYIAGESYVPWGDPISPFIVGDVEAFVAKLDNNGGILWNTFMGGSGYDGSYGITADEIDNIYVAGFSTASWGAPIAPYDTNEEAFVVKFNNSGIRQWNTFLGGQGYDAANAILYAPGGYLYIPGESNAAWGTPKNPFSGDFDAFVSKLAVSKFPWIMMQPAIINKDRP